MTYPHDSNVGMLFSMMGIRCILFMFLSSNKVICFDRGGVCCDSLVRRGDMRSHKCYIGDDSCKRCFQEVKHDVHAKMSVKQHDECNEVYRLYDSSYMSFRQRYLGLSCTWVWYYEGLYVMMPLLGPRESK